MKLTVKKSALFIGLIILVITAVLLIINSKTEPKYLPTQISQGTWTFGEGKLKVFNGVNFLTVKGSYYQAGMQYGVLLRDQLKQAIEELQQLVYQKVGTFFIKRWIYDFMLNRKTNKVKKIVPREYLEQLKGISDGSGISYRKVKTLAFYPILLANKLLGCSTIVEKVADRFYTGRNVDYPGPVKLAAKYPTIVKYNIAGKIPFVDLSIIGQISSFSGINDTGISMVSNTFSGKTVDGNQYENAVYHGFKIREVLENAGTIAQAIEILKGYRNHGILYIITSPKDSCIAEILNGEILIERFQKDHLFITNLPVTPKGRYKYSPIDEHWPGNINREEKIKEFLKVDYPDEIDKIKNILSYSEYQDDPDPLGLSSICRNNTMQSCIFENSGDFVYAAYGPGYAPYHTWYRFDKDLSNITIYKERNFNPKVRNFIDINETVKRPVVKGKTKEIVRKLWVDYYRQRLNVLKDADIVAHIKYYKLGLFNHVLYLETKKEEYLKSAFANAEKLLARYPNYPMAYSLLSGIEFQEHNFAKALEWRLKELELKSLTPNGRFHSMLGLVEANIELFKQTGKTTYLEEAKEWHKKSKELISRYLIGRMGTYWTSKSEELLAEAEGR